MTQDELRRKCEECKALKKNLEEVVKDRDLILNAKFRAEKRVEELETQQGISVKFGGTMFNCAFEQDVKIKKLQHQLAEAREIIEKSIRDSKLICLGAFGGNSSIYSYGFIKCKEIEAWLEKNQSA